MLISPSRAALSQSQSHALDASYRFCGALSRHEARNFYYSFLLLPPHLRRSMCALYAFMRRTDDLADDPTPGQGQGQGQDQAQDHGAILDRWRGDVHRAIETGDHRAWPGLAALAATVERHAIPPRYLDAVIDGVTMDLHPRPFSTFDDLYGYCYRVASAVGLCCLHIWGYRSEGGRAETLAEACGIALQLTNIVRDVREDAQNGRLYLPQEDLGRFGVAPEELAARRTSSRVRDLLAYEARRAYVYYDKAQPLASLVDPVGRPALATIVGIYRTLLDEIVRRDYDVLTTRVALPSWRKVAITLRSLSGRFLAPGPAADPPEVPRC
jgi:phytoene synthase